jgi:hypothetical protein
MWGTVIGFGRTQKTLADDESSGNGSNTLMESSLQIITNSKCSAMYAESKDAKISASMLCAYAAGTDTCQVILIFLKTNITIIPHITLKDVMECLTFLCLKFVVYSGLA